MTMFDWLKRRKAQNTKGASTKSEREQRIGPVTPYKELHKVNMEVNMDMVCMDFNDRWEFQGMVLYLEDEYNPIANKLINSRYEEIARRFKDVGYAFIYAPKESEAIAQYYGVDTLGVEWNAETLLKMQGCLLNEPIGTAIVRIDDIAWNAERQSWTAKIKGVKLDAKSTNGLMAQIWGYWSELRYQACRRGDAYMCSCINNYDDEDISCCVASEKKIKYSAAELLFTEDGESAQCKRDTARKDETRTMYREGRSIDFDSILKGLNNSEGEEDVDILEEEQCRRGFTSTPTYATYAPKLEKLSDEDRQLLHEIEERVNMLRRHGVKEHFIQQIVRLTVKPSPLEVTNDARLMLTDYGKEVSMLPIDKAVYLFFLRHPEGVPIKELCDYSNELANIYLRILHQKRLNINQKESVERLCNPLDNSINEKISRIRQAFRAVVHDSVADSYTIQGGRGERRHIALDEELIVWDEWGKI